MARGVKPPSGVLTIAGSDGGGGAGVLADARTIAVFGRPVFAAVAAITAQNRQGIRRWQAVPPTLLRAQVEAVLQDFAVGAIKSGLLPTSSAVRTVATVLKRHPSIPLVVDPVLGSTSGTRFLGPTARRVLIRELLPRAALATPNWPEVAALTGLRVTTVAEAERAGRQLAASAGCPVLVKGGHAVGRQCVDLLVWPDGRTRRWRAPRLPTRNTHGTGCVLSAAIAAGLAEGLELTAAISGARTFLRRQLRRGHRVDWGGGIGPVLGW